uniref:Fatty acid desaturase domain-containing protein n=1 Tax=Calcidiscus leptoporus TaxID=127549 RepID=A0A7S0ITH6_9EUKA|mmetsp:Transcript_21830/g.50200  ORF Transcript_21830/g.50200 Transcript_21830/m.50200 type:complete len:492 (+) Transcript_21830:46-1521(+)|eukprot:CAMPEP_0119376880 /NCGR_PEP_ID=MMETSP1334-20130426/41869_1 /TAXON_ID=127549 /ORGANISM="Calcidiscus leptoporus, Strain RCC1130" /LENGTH=491 /DNA_ID=CAMNT_0007395599 /DNA_START=28 /DNA_END=1503 /DNA_ORIENTATION=-
MAATQDGPHGAVQRNVKEPSAWARFFDGLGPADTLAEGTRVALGALFFATVGPFVFASAMLSTLWEAADRGFDGGIFLSGREQTGFLVGTVAPAINRVMHPFNKRLVKHEQDAYMVNAVLLLGLFVPLLFVLCGLHTLRAGYVSPLLCIAYHQFRIGPFVMNFGYVYALAHREGHAIAARTGLWRAPYDKRGPLRYIFNYWIGLFFGVTPASFDVGHSIIHHKHSNDELDTITCADRPRDNWVSYVSYLPRFALYAANITTLTHFWAQAREHGQPYWRHFNNTLFGSGWYLGFVAVAAQAFGGRFALCYVVYPFMEQVLLLMMANWSWHAFLDPLNPLNEEVGSTTILNGQINVLNEDAHVTHHKYPGTHWSNTPSLLEKHRAEYDSHGAAGEHNVHAYGSVFKNTHVFEVGGLCVAAEYAELARRFVGSIPEGRAGAVLGVGAHERHLLPEVPSCPLPQPVVEELLKARLRYCWHGPRAKAAAATSKKDR